MDANYLYSTREVAHILQIPNSQVRRLARKHGIGEFTSSNWWRFNKTDVYRLAVIIGLAKPALEDV